MTIAESILLGVLQGVTEFLPVSSSGHLALFGRIFSIDEAAMLSLTTLLHMGTLIAVLVVMRREILAILKDLFGPKTWQLVVATIPAIIAALLLGDFLDTLFGGAYLGVSFLLTGFILLLSQLSGRVRRPRKEITMKDALAAGIGQAVAILPGVSRSGTTLTTLLLSGVARTSAIRFSFLMSIPAILGGFVLDLKDLLSGGSSAITMLGAGPIIVGVLAAGLAGWLVMELMLQKLSRRGLLICAAYVLVLGAWILVDQNLTHWIAWN